MRDHDGRAGPARLPRPSRRWWRPRLAGLAGVVVAVALAVAACGGDNKTAGVASLAGATQTTSAGNANSGKGQAALNWARCMRQHGIDLPDPKFDAWGHSQQQLPSGAQTKSPKFKAADQACQKYLPNGGASEKPNPQEQQQMLQFARCMRQHGIADFPDPDNGHFQWPGSPERDTPKFKAAQQACERAVPPARP
jgi:hypothetical protein